MRSFAKKDALNINVMSSQRTVLSTICPSFTLLFYWFAFKVMNVMEEEQTQPATTLTLLSFLIQNTQS